MKKGKPGRPALPPDERAQTVTVRLGPSDRVALKALKTRWKCNTTDAVKKALLVLHEATK